MKAVFAVILFTLSVSAYSQEWTKVDPGMTSILSDTNLVLAYVASIEPGQKSLMHTHSAAFVYSLTDLKLKVYYADGQVETFDVPAGLGMFANPEKMHQTENIGDKTAKFLLVELKEHPYVTAGVK